MKLRGRIVAACALLMLMGDEAMADAPAYVGTWASQPSQCAVDQSMQAAPMIMARNRYDQHEAHCSFASVRKSGVDTWRVQARCSVEGDSQKHAFTMKVDGGRLTMRDATGTRTLTRCR